MAAGTMTFGLNFATHSFPWNVECCMVDTGQKMWLDFFLIVKYNDT